MRDSEDVRSGAVREARETVVEERLDPILLHRPEGISPEVADLLQMYL